MPVSNILDKQINRYVASPEEIGQIYEHLRDYARAKKDAIITGNLEDFATLMSTAYQEEKIAVDGLTTDWVDQIYDTAMAHGAIGGRIMGAGGICFFTWITGASGKLFGSSKKWK